MARVTLTIEANDAIDLASSIAHLAGTTAPYPGDYHGEESGETGLQPEAGATQDAEPGERQARFKRTKSEIERGLSVEQAKAERAAAASNPNSGPSSEGNGQSPTTSESSEADPFSASASQPTSPVSPGSLTTSDVRKAMGDFLNRDGNDAAKIKDILHQFKTDTGAIVEAASGLQSDDYAAFIERLAA